jgi:hypothetical protein
VALSGAVRRPGGIADLGDVDELAAPELAARGAGADRPGAGVIGQALGAARP